MMSLEPLPKLADLLQIAINAATAGAEELTAQSGEPFETHTKGEIGNLVTSCSCMTTIGKSSGVLRVTFSSPL